MSRRPDRVMRGPLAPYAAGFRAELARQGYSKSAARKHLRLMAQLREWAEGRGFGVVAATTTRADEFFSERRTAGRANLLTTRALRPLLEYLRRREVVPEEGPSVIAIQDLRLLPNAQRGRPPGWLQPRRWSKSFRSLDISILQAGILSPTGFRGALRFGPLTIRAKPLGPLPARRHKGGGRLPAGFACLALRFAGRSPTGTFARLTACSGDSPARYRALGAIAASLCPFPYRSGGRPQRKSRSVHSRRLLDCAAGVAQVIDGAVKEKG